MKRALPIATLLVAMLVICAACQTQLEQDIEVSEVGTIDFYSEEEFISAIKAAKENPTKDDFVNLAGVEFYYKPNKLPQGYVLYQVNVGKHDIGIVYLLKEDAASKESAMDAMGRLDYYMLITYRNTPFGTLKQELGLDEYAEKVVTGMTRNEFPEMYHYIGSPDTVFWGNDEVSMMLQYPENSIDTKSPDSFYAEACAEYVEIP